MGQATTKGLKGNQPTTTTGGSARLINPGSTGASGSPALKTYSTFVWIEKENKAAAGSESTRLVREMGDAHFRAPLEEQQLAALRRAISTPTPQWVVTSEPNAGTGQLLTAFGEKGSEKRTSCC